MSSTYNFDEYFPHKQLTKIPGHPDTKSLQTLVKQLRRNARSVNTSLGGGQYGHLFLVLSDLEWNALPNTVPVVEPQDPGPFTLTGGRSTSATVALEKEQHAERKNRYKKFQALKRIIKNQLVEVFDPVFLDPIRCGVTDMITSDISTIITFLKSTYGELSVDEMEEEIVEIKLSLLTHRVLSTSY